MRQRGFTLIELLIVITIIGVLTSIVFSSIGVARVRARDSARVQNLRQLHLAAEIYYAEYGQCPSLPVEVGPNNVSSTDSNGWEAGFVTQTANYISALPATVNSKIYTYRYATGNGTMALGFFTPSLQYSCINLAPGSCFMGVVLENTANMPSNNAVGAIPNNSYYVLMVGKYQVGALSNVAFCPYTL